MASDDNTRQLILEQPIHPKMASDDNTRQLILEQYQAKQRQKLKDIRMENELAHQKQQHKQELQQLHDHHQLEIKPLIVDLLAAGAVSPSIDWKLQEQLVNKMIALEHEMYQMQCRQEHELKQHNNMN